MHPTLCRRLDFCAPCWSLSTSFPGPCHQQVAVVGGSGAPWQPRGEGSAHYSGQRALCGTSRTYQKQTLSRTEGRRVGERGSPFPRPDPTYIQHDTSHAHSRARNVTTVRRRGLPVSFRANPEPPPAPRHLRLHPAPAPPASAGVRLGGSCESSGA